MQNVSHKPVDDSLEQIIAPVDADMDKVNAFISNELHSDIVLINTISNYIISNGGKRLRPVTLLLAAGACGNTTAHQIPLAAIIEFIHTATLLHDDVVDASELRRGQVTANDVWGNQASVLVGDFLYSRAFQQMVKINEMRVMDILADTTNMIAEGEVLQLMNSHNAGITENDYYETIKRKTAILFKAACQLGAVISNASEETEQALADYGLNMGIAFQLIDDVLDYFGDAEKTGKNIGDDLNEGKATLPLIRAMKVLPPAEKQIIVDVIENDNDPEQINRVIEIINTTDAMKYSKQHALSYTQKATQVLTKLEDSIFKKSLLDLSKFFISRVS